MRRPFSLRRPQDQSRNTEYDGIDGMCLGDEEETTTMSGVNAMSVGVMQYVPIYFLLCITERLSL